MNIEKKKKGFTLLEVAMAVALLAVVAAFGISSFFNFRNSTDIESTSRNIADVLRRAQANAVSGEDFTMWGVRFDNVSTPFYQLFSGPSWGSGTKKDYFSLSSGIEYTTPLSGNAAEMVFEQRTGRSLVGSFVITVRSTAQQNVSRTIAVSGEGTINIQ